MGCHFGGVPAGCRHRQVHRSSGEGSDGFGSGLGGFGAEPGHVQNNQKKQENKSCETKDFKTTGVLSLLAQLISRVQNCQYLSADFEKVKCAWLMMNQMGQMITC